VPLYNPQALGRWLTPVVGGVAAGGSSTFTVGRVMLTQIVIPTTCRVDGMTYVTAGTSAGSVIGGIVGPITQTADDATGAVVVAQSASTAMGATNAAQLLTWTAVTLRPGIYYVCLEGSDATGTYQRYSNLTQAPGMSATYDRAGGYGALTDPTPTVSATGNNVPGIRLRIA
jgi:hypothetical protein